jgi:hypothetical protein
MRFLGNLAESTCVEPPGPQGPRLFEVQINAGELLAVAAQNVFLDMHDTR